MKRFFVALVAIFLTISAFAQYRTGAGYDDLYDSETVRSFKEHVRTLAAASLEGRKAGSEGEDMAAEYVSEILAGYGVELVSPGGEGRFGIRSESGDTLTSRNVIGFIPGYDKSLRDKYIVIGAHLDGSGTDTFTVDGQMRRRIYYGANGNASGVAMLLELARMLQTNRVLLRRSVLLVGFGASEETFAGAWYFLNRSFSDISVVEAMINLDMLGRGGDGFYAYTSSNADLDAAVASQNADLQPIAPTLTTTEPYPSDHRAFYAQEIPSVLFTTGRYSEYRSERDTPDRLDYDTMERELEYIYGFTVALVNGPAVSFRPSPQGNKQTTDAAVSYYDIDYRPTFLGSSDPKLFMEKWVYQYLRYPEEAVLKGITGRVSVSFIIDEKGNVTDVRVTRGSDPLLDAEAVRVIAASPKWKPGRHRGRKVKTAMSVPVEFRLTKNATIGMKK